VKKSIREKFQEPFYYCNARQKACGLANSENECEEGLESQNNCESFLKRKPSVKRVKPVGYPLFDSIK